MSYFEALLVAEARKRGRAQRSATLRHRHIAKRPIGLLLWQLGAEPFTAAAAAWGYGPKERSITVPGEPRDRELAFRALAKMARAFNAYFEGGERDEPPQIILPNRGNLTLLGRLGRRLAYLPSDGPTPADPELVRFGRHLKWLHDHARNPGQQLVLVLTELMSEHWVTELSGIETQNLPAMDAAIEPPRGMSAHDAAFEAEAVEIGPVPSGNDDDAVDPLVRKLNEARARGTDERVVAPLRKPIEAHYAKLVDRGWPLVWKCLERERTFKAAPHVARRWAQDLEDLDRHLDWAVTKGLPYRTRQTHEQAARTLQSWEEAYSMLLAEEAVDDPLRMLPYILANDAVAGRVVKVDLDHRGHTGTSEVRRPLVELEVDEQCTVPAGKVLYWTGTPAGREYVVDHVRASAKGTKTIVTLIHQTGSAGERPEKGTSAVFSVHTTKASGFFKPKQPTPWTHKRPPAHSEPIEGVADEGSWE
jgi:hypothetical protein